MPTGLEADVIAIVILIFSVILHEVAHGYAAYLLGDPTAKLQGRLTLNPLPHIDPVGSIIVPILAVMTFGMYFGWAKPVPYNPYNLKNQRWGRAIVGVAGVAVNLLIAVIFAFIARGAYAASMSGVAEFALIVVITNLSLGIFNLIPFPPLDGYTVLEGVLPLPLALSLRAFEERLQSLGPFTLLIFLVLFSNFFAGAFSHLIFFLFRLLVG
jgi:Zn-dependent protease